MTEITADGAVWAAFLWPREIARLHGIIGKLRMPLFNREDMVQMSFTLWFVTVLEVVAEDDVSCFDFLISLSFFKLMFFELWY